MTGYTGTLSGTAVLNISPNVTGTHIILFAGTVTWTGALNINANHTSAVINFTSAGKILSRDFTAGSIGNGKIVQQDDFAPQSTSNKPSLLFTTPTSPWDMNGFKIIGNATYRYMIGENTRGLQAVLTLNGGAAGASTQFEYIDFRDILLNNGGSDLDLSAITGLSGDCQGNGMSGGGTLTFTTSAAQTWDGTAGNYSDNTKWTSRSPLPQDDVIFSNFGGAGRTLNYDKRAAGRSVDFSGLTSAANKPTFSASAGATAFNWYGNLNLASTTYLTFSFANFIMNFEGRSNSSLTCAGQDLGNFVIAGAGATLQAQDAVTASVSLAVASGAFDTQGYSSTVGAWGNGSGVEKEYIGSGAIIISGATLNEFNINSASMTWSHTGPITVTYTGATDRNFYFGTVAASRTMANNITIAGGGAGIITFQVSTSVTLNGTFKITGGALTAKFVSGTTVNLADGTGFGNGTNLITLATTAAGAVTFNKTGGGTVQYDYIDITNINATPADTFFYGANGVLHSGTGWTAGLAPSLGGFLSTMKGIW